MSKYDVCGNNREILKKLCDGDLKRLVKELSRNINALEECLQRLEKGLLDGSATFDNDDTINALTSIDLNSLVICEKMGRCRLKFEVLNMDECRVLSYNSPAVPAKKGEDIRALNDTSRQSIDHGDIDLDYREPREGL